MKVRELMQTPHATVQATDTWGVAARMMLWAGVKHLPVLDRGRVVGIVTHQHFLERQTRGELNHEEPLAGVHSNVAQSAHPEEDVMQVAARMTAGRLDCVPVLEGERLVGLLTTTELLTQLVGEQFQAGPGPVALIRHVMTRDPVAISFDDRLLDAIARMNHRGVRHLPVVDGNRHVVGMLSDRDVRTAVGELMSHDDKIGIPARARLLRVADVARKFAYTVSVDAPLSLAIRLLIDHRVGALPVIDHQKRLVGIVSYLDVLERGLAGPLETGRPLGKATETSEQPWH